MIRTVQNTAEVPHMMETPQVQHADQVLDVCVLRATQATHSRAQETQITVMISQLQVAEYHSHRVSTKSSRDQIPMDQTVRKQIFLWCCNDKVVEVPVA